LGTDKVSQGFCLPHQLETVLNWSNAPLAPVHLYWNEILNDYIIPGKFDPTFMITHRIPLEDMAKVYHEFDKREFGVIKVFVEAKASSPPMAGCPKTAGWRIGVLKVVCLSLAIISFPGDASIIILFLPLPRNKTKVYAAVWNASQ
jgi:hypothetical protein